MLTMQTLIDQAEIRDVHLRYCRGIDRMDWELVRSCYHLDATDDHGGYSGPVDGFIDWVAGALARYETTTHFTGNQLIEVDGDVAWAEHYALVTHRRPAAGDQPASDLIVNIRYVDRMERRGGEWRIARRIVLADSDRLDVVSETWLDKSKLQASRRDRSDPSYAR